MVENKRKMNLKIDAHHHFWHYNPVEYAWITDAMQDLKRDFLPEDLQILLARRGFSGSVAVQARQSEKETEWLLDLAEKHDFIKGVVGWVDLCAGDVDEKLAKYAGGRKLCAVRHVLQDEPDADFMLRRDFRHGVGKLSLHGLAYDILVFSGQLPRAIRLVRNFPGQVFILDHLAKPLIRKKELQPWKQDIEKLAACQHVACKLSGMVTEADWHSWKDGDFRPYMDAVVDAFGTDRVMIGSDWPVCTLAGSYDEVMALAEEYVGQFSRDEREMMLGANAIRLYSLSC